MLGGKEIKWQQAPCKPDGEITSDGQEESREGTCRCPDKPEGCCVGGFGIILPKTLKEDFDLSVFEWSDKNENPIPGTGISEVC